MTELSGECSMLQTLLSILADTPNANTAIQPNSPRNRALINNDGDPVKSSILKIIWVKVPEILNTENPHFKYRKLPFPYTLYRTKQFFNTEFSINTENINP